MRLCRQGTRAAAPQEREGAAAAVQSMRQKDLLPQATALGHAGQEKQRTYCPGPRPWGMPDMRSKRTYCPGPRPWGMPDMGAETRELRSATPTPTESAEGERGTTQPQRTPCRQAAREPRASSNPKHWEVTEAPRAEKGTSGASKGGGRERRKSGAEGAAELRAVQSAATTGAKRSQRKQQHVTKTCMYVVNELRQMW